MRERRHFTLFAERCVQEGCTRPAGALGFCREHYTAEIDRLWDELQAEGRVAPKWDCFDTDKQWQEYEVHSLTLKDGRRPTVSPCKDCTPEYQQSMAARGRCRHPEVVFIRKKGELIGQTSEDFVAWAQAMAGLTGPVVALPPMSERIKAATEARHEARRQ